MEAELRFDPAPDGAAPLYRLQRGWEGCQPPYLCIDGDGSTVSFSLSERLEAEREGRVIRVSVPGEIRGEVLRARYEEAKPLIRRVWWGFRIDQDSSTLDEDAAKALDDLRYLLEGDVTDSDFLRIQSAWSWVSGEARFRNEVDQVNGFTADDDIQALIAAVAEEARKRGIFLTGLDDLQRALTGLRDDLNQENA